MDCLRLVRGAKELVNYLKGIGVPMSEGTIYNLLRENNIPHSRPSARILVFDLNEIDEWLKKGTY